jgi:quercetin dioxygenase-like cupin family protein
VSASGIPKAKEEYMSEIQKISWKTKEAEKLSDSLSRQVVFGEKGTLAQLFIKRGGAIVRHSHISEEYASIVSGAVRYVFDDREVVVNAGEVLVVPSNVPHSVIALEDAVAVFFFSPGREDWVRGEDQYLRKQGNAETVTVGVHRASS